MEDNSFIDEATIHERHRKRQRVHSDYTEYSNLTCRQLVLEELDVELGLRERLSETVRSRLVWALLLQDALEKDSKAPDSAEVDFQDTALDALQVIEEPCNHLFEGDITLFEKPIPLSAYMSTSAVSSSPDISTISQPSPRIGSTRIRGQPRAPPLPAKKLLFLRDTFTVPSTIAKLACPDCARSDFSNLQGLLNHCRLRHHREYGSHDECMQSCAVLVPEEERDWVVANGTELGGISLPSLRRLFEIALGAGDRVVIPGLQRESDPEKAAIESMDVSREDSELNSTSTHIARTLGYHKDSPALAPFLGRAPKKRVINVYGDEGQEIDILSRDDEVPGRPGERRRAWRMPYNHRNIARPELDETPPVSKDIFHGNNEPEGSEIPIPLPLPPLPSVASSRFHIVARLKLADHSLWLPPDRHPASRPGHSHRWRLSVSAPSYSLHITTFLAKLTVTCVTDPPPSTLSEPITVTEPPFVVTSTADKPFLARLTFSWVGNQNAPTDVEHWVDLDPLHLAHPVLGDEQVFDVELDRNTELLPVREDSRKIRWDYERPGGLDQRYHHDKSSDEKDRSTGDAYPDHVAALRKLLPQIPITTKDVKGRAVGSSTLMLIPSPAQFRNMVLGRRKAIEMSRARALRDAYEQYVASLSDKGNHIPLTTIDVYRWMEDENIFPRPISEKRSDETHAEESPAMPNLDAYCRRCGLSRLFHPGGVKSEDAPLVDIKDARNDGTASVATAASVCLEFNGASTRPPLFDVNRLLDAALSTATSLGRGVPYNLAAPLFAVPTTYLVQPGRVPSSSDLVAIAHPRLVTAIRSISATWKLDHFQAPAYSFSSPADDPMCLTETSKSRQDLVEGLAPYALLAAITRSMIRLLVQGGLDAVRQDENAMRSLGRHELMFTRRKTGHTQTAAAIRRLLTPSHILRGLILGAQRGAAESATLLYVARMGTGNGMDAVTSKIELKLTNVIVPHAEMMHASRPIVKVEEEDPCISTRHTNVRL